MWKDSKSGTFCYQHLWQQLYTNNEYDPLQKWYEREHGEVKPNVDSEVQVG